ncbi:nucleotidyltransferase domain-containing protein, partial [Bacillus sp. IITD106]|nr:nucleotidyltransferase domain-containing protein [Bacillus sp. IITD106]
MLSQQEILHELTKKLQILQRNYGVKRIGLFGSYSRDEQTNESDIDILVDFKEEFVTFDN